MKSVGKNSTIVIKVAVTAAIVMLLANCGGKSATKAVIECRPPSAAALDKASSIAQFKSFATAVKQSDQVCADALSSKFFIQSQRLAHPASNGKWITSKRGGLPSTADRLSKLPSSFNDADFAQSDYVRAIVEDGNGAPSSVNAPQVKGLTLSHLLDGANGIKYHLDISFVLQDGEIVVDDFSLEPTSLDAK